MDTLRQLFHMPFVRRMLFILLTGVVLYLARSMITLLLLTFIFIYLINAAQKFIYRVLSRFFPIRRTFIVVFLYVAVIALLTAVVYYNAAAVVTQFAAIVETVTAAVKNYKAQTASSNQFLAMIYDYLKNIDFDKYVQASGEYIVAAITNVGIVAVDVLIAIILSLFFMLEKSRILAFVRRFDQSKIKWLYEDAKYFGVKFTNSFGKVIETQIVISLINSAISVVSLGVLGFPNLLGLWAMVFLLGLIPVAGVFISLVPLCIIAYSIGGLREIVYVLILIAVLHATESYVLNPKLMSHNTKLPVFVTFLVLIVSERIMGVWGLIVGIPIVMFLLDVFEVPSDTPTKEGPAGPDDRKSLNGKPKAGSAD